MAYAFHLGAGVSAAAASNAAIPALSIILPAAALASPLAVTACFVGVMTCFGAIFGINFPKIGGYLQNLAGDLLSGKAIDASWEKDNGRAPQITQQLDIAKSIAPTLALEYDNPQSDHAAKFQPRSASQEISYREMVSQPSANAVLEV